MELDVYFRDQIHRLEKIDNLGQTQDHRDLYTVIERWSQAIDHKHPLRCAQGCSECCKADTLPRASRTDWQILHAHLLTLPEAQQTTILERNRTRYLPHAEALLKQVRTGDGPPPEVALPPENPCPLLEEGRCGAYAGRPLICRVFGYFVHGPSRHVMSCGPGMQHLEGLIDQGLKVALPDVLPIFETWSRLSGYPDAPLPLWLLAHDQGDRLDPVCQTTPDFARVILR